MNHRDAGRTGKSRGVSMLGLRTPLMLGILVLLLAAGCAAQQSSAPGGSPGASNDTPKRGGVLDMAFANVQEPPYLDPLRAGSNAYLSLVAKTYSHLVQSGFDKKEVLPELAERWEISPDGKTYTFYLHKGVKWHDGAPFSAADVKYSLDRTRDPNDPKAKDLSGKRQNLSVVDRVEVVDDNTVRLHMKSPSNAFMEFLSNGTQLISPKHAEAKGIDLDKEVLGTGPYKLSEYQRGSVFRVVRNPDYFIKDLPYLDGINVYLLKDNATALAAFSTGQIKLLPYVFAPDIEQIKSSVPQAVVSTKDAVRNAYMAWNYKTPVIKDVRVRRAIFLAIDRQAAINILAPGESQLGTLFAPAVSTFSKEELLKLPGYRPDKTQDIAEAKRLLAEAGYPNGFKTDMIFFGSVQDNADTAIFLMDQLRKLGIEATSRPLTVVEKPAVEQAGSWEMQGSTGTGSLDPGTANRHYTPGNAMNFDDRFFEGLRLQQDATVDPVERKKIWRQMEQYYLDQALYPVLFWKVHSAVMYPEVRGFEMIVGTQGATGYNYDDVWLAQ